MERNSSTEYSAVFLGKQKVQVTKTSSLLSVPCGELVITYEHLSFFLILGQLGTQLN